MKDWFYASGSEVVHAQSGITKNRLVKEIKSGFKSVPDIQDRLGIVFDAGEIEDVRCLIKIYGPMSHDQLGGCSGCDGCAGELVL